MAAAIFGVLSGNFMPRDTEFENYKQFMDNISTFAAILIFDIYSENAKFFAKVKSEMGGLREFSARNIEKLMEQVIIDVSEEFDNL